MSRLRGARKPSAVVAQREFALKVRNKGFVISMALTVLSIIGVSIAAVAFGDREGSVKVAITPSYEPVLKLSQRLAERADPNLTIDVIERPTASRATAAVRDETADVALVPTSVGADLVARDDVDTPATKYVQEAFAQVQLTRNAKAAGVDLSELNQGSVIGSRVLDADGVSATTVRVAGVVLAMAFYFGALLFGAVVGQAVLEEKQNRVVEIVATLMPLRQLLMGKLIGSTLVVLLQISVMAGSVVLIGYLLDMKIALPRLSLAAAWFVAFFVVGYIAVASLWAAAGAMATRQEDLQHTATPVSLLLIIVIPVGVFLSGPALTIASFVPIANVVAMPTRVLAGETTWWEPLVSIAGLGLFTAALINFAAVIYRRSLMQTQRRLTMREAVQLVD